jgi:hypothetical protein
MTDRRAPAALALLALSAPSLAACAAGFEAPEEVGYVLLDAQARAAGRLSHGDWEGAPLLPVALEVEAPAAFTSSAGRTEIALRPGMLAWVHGAGGAVEWQAIGHDASPDHLRVLGSREAAADLAQRLAGEVEGEADGAWTVTAPDVFDRGSFLAPPPGVSEVEPKPLLGLARAASPFGTRAVALGAGAPGADPGVQFVGLYTHGDHTLLLDTAGGFSLAEGCSGEGSLDEGRWHTEANMVVLDGAHGQTTLVYDPRDGTLGDPSGAAFSSAAVDSIIAAMPREAP